MASETGTLDFMFDPRLGFAQSRSTKNLGSNPFARSNVGNTKSMASDTGTLDFMFDPRLGFAQSRSTKNLGSNPFARSNVGN